LKTIPRRSFFLLIIILLIITSARVQESATSASTARDKSIQWRVHLALQLVKRPELSGPQVQVILDAISILTPEFFEASSNASSRKTYADDALQSLARRAMSEFPNNQAPDLFSIAEGQAEEDLLKLYDAVSALPKNETQALFRNTSAKDKSALWRTHLALFLAKHPEINERQKEVILAALSLATPEFFEIRPTESAWRTKARTQLRSLEQRIVVAFSLADAEKIFATLHDDTKTMGGGICTSPVMLTTINYQILSHSGPNEQGKQRFANQVQFKINSEAMEKETGRSACQCSTESDWCPVFGRCSGSDCNRTQNGCGTLWSYPCDGTSCR